jgi:hypothetical protein
MRAYVEVEKEGDAFYYGPFDSVRDAQAAAQKFRKENRCRDLTVNVLDEAELSATYEKCGPALIFSPIMLGPRPME